MQYEEIIQKLELNADPKAKEGMARYGITPIQAYGVSIPTLRSIAKNTGKNHELSQKLWASNIRETRILASMIDNPGRVTQQQMDQWVHDFDYWEICDQCCINLFENTRFAYQKAVEWSSHHKEFVKRAGFVLMARLAVSDKTADDRLFESFFPRIQKESEDTRHYVKKAVNWSLRQIGKRNLTLNKKAIRIAHEILKMDSKTAKWIASDALKELTSEAIQRRLQAQLR